jgi:hypothetical protein
VKPIPDRFPRRFPIVLKVKWLPDGSKVEERYTSWLVFKCWWRYRVARSYPWQKNEPLTTECNCSTEPPTVVNIY